jgi:hypothetical protein
MRKEFHPMVAEDRRWRDVIRDRLPMLRLRVLGNDTTRQYHNRTGRPFAILPSGRPIDELL